MKKSLWVFGLVLISNFTAFADKTIYVAPVASGSGSGVDAANPCRIVTALANLAATGTTTLVFPANATFNLADADGTANSSRIGVSATTKIIFEGNNSTINGQNQGTYRSLRLAASTDIEIRNLNFINGKCASSVGGAIFFAGASLIISGCTFDGNSSDNGGALASRGNYVKISNSVFKNNKLINGYYGCAITHTGTTSGGTLIIENTTFTNNTGGTGKATYGSAISTAWDNGVRGYLNTVSINNCAFYKNLSGLTTTYGYSAVNLDELSGGTTTATFVNNTFYGNSNCGIYIKGIKQTVKLVNNLIIGDAWATISGTSYNDHGIIAEKNTLTDLRPAIVAYNNYIVAKGTLSTTITELSSGTNGNTFVTTASQSSIDNVYLSSTLQGPNSNYQSITNGSSPLVNTGTNSVSGVTIPTTDMRGIARGNSGTTGASYDIGSFELSKLAISTDANISESGLTDTELAGAEITVTGGEYTIDATKNLNVIKVQPGAKLTLNSGSAVSSGKICLQSTSSGTATFVDNNSATSTVAGNVEQYLPQGRNWYVSSPISAGSTANLNTGTSVLSYNESTAAWITESGSLTAGKGYISVSSAGTGTSNIIYDGTLNTGNVSVTLSRTGSTKTGFNLVGNPYPSYLDFSKVDTTASNILSSIWYRTKTTPVNGVSSYTFDTYNGKSNIATSLGATPVTNLIPPMQAFWVRVKSGTDGILTFNNSMRAHADNVTNKLKAPRVKEQTQQLLRLEVSNGVNRDQAIIYSNANALNGYDSYDSPKMTNGSANIPEIYTSVGVEKLVINGLESLTDNVEIPLGFSTGQTNTFRIKATESTNLSDIDIILIDKLLNTEFSLSNGDSYTFKSDITSSESRFSVLFRAKSTNTEIGTISTIKVSVLSQDKSIIIENKEKVDNNLQITIFNNAGQLIKKYNMSQTLSEIKNMSSGLYVVKVQSKNSNITHKVIVE